MVFPTYLIQIGLPLVLGMVGIFLYTYQRQQPISEHQNQNRNRNQSFNTIRTENKFCDNSEICPICLEDMMDENSLALNCGHRLHNVCLVELHKRRQYQCPKCRTNIIFK